MARTTAASKKKAEIQDALDLTHNDTAPLDVTAAAANGPSADEATVTTGTWLQPVEAVSDIVEYNPLVAELDRITSQYANVVWDLKAPEGLQAAKAARRDVQKVRFAIQNTEKLVLVPYQDAVKFAQDRVNKVKEFGSNLRDKVLVIEEPLDALVTAEEKRLKAEKERLAAIALERAERIDSAIQGYRLVGATYAASTAVEIAQYLETLQNTVILPDDFGDREGEATIARDHAIDTLTALHKLTVNREADAQRLAEQAAQLERMRVERVELERQAEERRQEQVRRDNEDLERQRAQLAEQQRALAEGLAQLERMRSAAAVPAQTVEAHVHTASEPERIETAAQIEDAPLAIAAVDPVEQPDPHAPSANDLVETIGLAFDVPPATARHWLRTTAF